MGIGARQTMRDQNRQPANLPTSDANDTPLRITRTYMDFPAPTSSSSPRRGITANPFNTASPGAPRPQGQRLVMSPEMRERIKARASQRGAAAAQAGNLLRATGGRGRGPGDRRTGGNRGDRRLRGRNDTAENEEGMGGDPDKLAQVVFERRGLPPRKWVDHTPEDLSIEDLRVDWPSIPTGQVGMVESVQEKLRWMARRMQHSYNTPQELAVRMQKGKMVYFESATEKEEVLKLVKEAEEKRADLLTEEEGFVKKPKRFGFQPVEEKDRNVLTKSLIQGVYPPINEPKQHSHQFLADVTRMLGNNETYADSEKRHLMGTILKLLPARRAPAPVQV
jgi:hypothetical protein